MALLPMPRMAPKPPAWSPGASNCWRARAATEISIKSRFDLAPSGEKEKTIDSVDRNGSPEEKSHARTYGSTPACSSSVPRAVARSAWRKVNGCSRSS